MLLVDSSIWIEHLRGSAPGTSDRLVAALAGPTELHVCGPIAMELLAGASPSQLASVQRLVGGLPRLALDADLDFHAAAELSRSARASGRTVRSLVDCLIAAVALRHGATVVHRDRDFDALAAISPLRTQRWD